MTALLTLLFGCASHRAVGPACATGDIPGRSLVIRVIGGAELAPYKSSSDVRSETIAEQLLLADGSAGIACGCGAFWAGRGGAFAGEGRLHPRLPPQQQQPSESVVMR